MGNFKPIIGQRFGKLVILDDFVKRTANNRSARYVLVKCDCGNIKEISKAHILAHTTISCGCVQSAMRKSFGAKRKNPQGITAFNYCYGAYKRSAQCRGYEFSLSKEEFRAIIVQPCIYCGQKLTQEKRSKSIHTGTFKYTGIDRYDNSKGYIRGNCVPCCKVCNRIKTNMTVQELEAKLTTILSNKEYWLYLNNG